MLFRRIEVCTFGSEATANKTCLANSLEAYENRLTLAMPMSEAASDIAGAMLKLNLWGTAVIEVLRKTWSG